MDGSKTAQLAQTLTALQGRWGNQAIGVLRDTLTIPEGISSGFPVLDALTGAGGIPVGYVTLLSGRPSSGVTTLAYHLAAGAQHQRRPVLWLDTNRVFDPASAWACRVDCSTLLLSRPPDWARALAITRDATEQLRKALLVVPLPLAASPQDILLLTDLLRFLPAICHRHSNALLLLDSRPEQLQRQAAILSRVALALEVKRAGWLANGSGVTARVTLLKSRFAPSEQWINVQIIYPERL